MSTRLSIEGKCIVDDISYSELCDKVSSIIKSGLREPRFIFSQNVLKAVKSLKSKEVKQTIEKADFVIPDGKGIVFFYRLLGYQMKEQVAGSTLFDRLLNRAAYQGHTVYFLGAKPGVAEQAALSFQNNYPQLCIAGVQHGYLDKASEESVINDINETRADMLFVGMGSPAQELFLIKHRNNLQVPICMGVGGSFDVYAGTLKRAPKIIQKTGLEWFFRLLQQPQRAKKIVPGFLKFLKLLIVYKLRSFKSPDIITRYE